MAPAHSHVITTSIQAWRLIEKDYTLRLSLVANKFAEEHQKAKNLLFAEARRRGNSAYLGPAWVDMEIEDTDKRAEWAYKTCCEVWEIQGHTKCRAFFRAVFEWCLQPIFAARTGCFQHEMELHQTRTGRTIPQGTAIYGHMTREMGRLISKWNTRLEIDTRDNEYQQELARQRDFEIERARLAQLPRATEVTVKRSEPRERRGASQAELRRMQVIFGALQLRLKGKEYCAELDRKNLPVPQDWVSDGCPNKFLAAYRDGTAWKKRIQDQKSKFQRRFDAMPPSEREQVIQGSVLGTRRTRQ